jgi:hypothetical protein
MKLAILSNVFLAIAIGCSWDAQAQEKDRAKSVIVPDNLSDWTLSFANVSIFEGGGPAVEVHSDGSWKWSKRRPAEPWKSTPARTKLNERELKSLYQSMAAVINKTQVSDGIERRSRTSERYTSDARIYRIRLSAGSRAIELKLEETQVSRLDVHDEFTRAAKLLEAPMRREDASPKIFGKPVQVRAEDKDEPIQNSRVVPDDLRDWLWVELALMSKNEPVLLKLKKKNGLESYGGLSVQLGSEKIHVSDVDPAFRQTFYETARLILNDFTLATRDAKHNDNTSHIRIGLDNFDRTVIAEFDLDESVPPEWRKRIEQIVVGAKKSSKP